MRTEARVAAAIGMALGLAACAAVGQSWPEAFRNPSLGGMQRASFEMGCPENQLQVVRLGDTPSVGVTGCGKRAVFTYVDGAGWMNDSADLAAHRSPSAEAEHP